VLDVERWAELRREHFVRGVSINELVRRTGLARNTIRTALRSDRPPTFRCPERRSKLDPFKDEIHRLLKDDPRLPGVRVRELIEPLGFDGGKSIVDDYLREVRPLFVKARTHQRTVYLTWRGNGKRYPVTSAAGSATLRGYERARRRLGPGGICTAGG
jgi:transposase